MIIKWEGVSGTHYDWEVQSLQVVEDETFGWCLQLPSIEELRYLVPLMQVKSMTITDEGGMLDA